MKIKFTKEVLHSSKKDKDYYIVRYVLVDKNDSICAKSSPILWLTKEQYDNLNV